MGNSPIEATKERDFDRSFILFGKGNSGKSTLGNLLLGTKKFKVHDFPEAIGLTKEVQSGDAMLDPGIVYGGCHITEQLKIQVLDQPGTNDCDFNQENHCEFLMKCIAESKGEMCANFLIFINFKSVYLSPAEFLSIMHIAEVLSNSNYSFFPNAAIVFTHADKFDENMNEGKLEQELRRKITDEKFAYIEDLIELVEGRYMFINGANDTEENRSNILKNLFRLTRTNLSVYINGYDGFEGKELKSLLGADLDANTLQINLLKYDVEHYFNPDLNLFRKYDTLDLGQEITQALNKLKGIEKGVSVIILLISLEEMYHQEIHDLFLNLPYTYKLGDEFEKNLWDYSCIIFKSQNASPEFIQRNIDMNPLLKELVGKVKCDTLQ